ncbi:hypothetical protein NKH18_47100 [Streptomyces sp. M10(2022)]
MMTTSSRVDLVRLAEEFWSWRMATQPDSYDDVTRVDRPRGWLPDWSPDAIAERRQMLAGFTRRHSGLDVSAAPVAEQVDTALLGSALARAHWELNLLCAWRRNPCFHLDQALVPLYNLLLLPTPWPGTQVRDIVDLLVHVPEVLQHARHHLTGNAAATFAQYALNILATADKSLGTAMSALGRTLPAAQARELSAGTDTAQRALVDYRRWLREHLPTFTASCSPSPKAFQYFLHRVALIPYPVQRLLDMSRQEYARTAAAEMVLRRRHRNLPEPALLADSTRQVDRQRADEQHIRTFLRGEGLVDLPDDLRHYYNTLCRPTCSPSRGSACRTTSPR